MVAVPEGDRLVAAEPDRALRVDVVERAREGDDPDLHSMPSTAATGVSTETVKSSITGLESRVAAIWRTSPRISSVSSPANSSSNRLPWRTSVTPEKPSRGSAPRTAFPWGSRISGLGMTSTTTRATGALLREGCECGLSLVARRWRSSGARALPPGECHALDGARGLRQQGGVAETLPLV